MMKTIPQEFLIKFDAQLLKNGIPSKNHIFFKKWLRYYLDFCSKYGHDPKHTESLPNFINKLREKNQNRLQQKQAYDSILIYYAMFDIYPVWSQRTSLNNGIETKEAAVEEKVGAYSKNVELVDTGWKSVDSRLNGEIKVRHYSPKTYLAYSKWVNQFRWFVKSKALEQLTVDDVKQFLTICSRQIMISERFRSFWNTAISGQP